MRKDPDSTAKCQPSPSSLPPPSLFSYLCNDQFSMPPSNNTSGQLPIGPNGHTMLLVLPRDDVVGVVRSLMQQNPPTIYDTPLRDASNVDTSTPSTAGLINDSQTDDHLQDEQGTNVATQNPAQAAHHPTSAASAEHRLNDEQTYAPITRSCQSTQTLASNVPTQGALRVRVPRPSSHRQPKAHMEHLSLSGLHHLLVPPPKRFLLKAVRRMIADRHGATCGNCLTLPFKGKCVFELKGTRSWKCKYCSGKDYFCDIGGIWLKPARIADYMTCLNMGMTLEQADHRVYFSRGILGGRYDKQKDYSWLTPDTQGSSSSLKRQRDADADDATERDTTRPRF